MPYRRGMALRPIVSDKHETTWTNLATDVSSTFTVVLVSPQQPASANAGNEVTIGSRVRSVYIEMQSWPEAVTATSVFHWKVELVRTGETITAPNLYYQTNRSTTLKRGMDATPKDAGTVTKRIFVVKIPRSFQRMKENQLLAIRFISTSATTMNFCGFAIFKEYK